MSFQPEGGSPESSVLEFFVNGRKITDSNADPEVTLLQYLRDTLCLRGTKLVCGEGGCGACTVMVSRLSQDTNNVRHFTVNACVAPVCSMHGLAVTTVEGIGSTAKGLHPVQERLAKSHGSQCGFCSPGMVMTMYTLLRNNPLPSALQLEQAFDGNLCRCTGYRPIIEGYKSFTKEYCAMGEKCCRNNETPSDGEQCEVSMGLFNASEFIPFDATQESIFPPELQITPSYDKENLVFVGEKVTWIRPVTLEHLLALKAQYPHARLLDIGMDKLFYTTNNPIMIATSHVHELNTIDQGASGVSFGASVCISLVQEKLKDMIATMPEHKTRTLRAIEDMLHLFAGHQIRNVATIGGSLLTASPVSDINTLFMATRASVVVQSKDGGKRTIKIDDRFFTGFRKTVLSLDEVVITVTIPYSETNDYISGYKQSQRRYNDIAIVNAGMYVQLKPDTDIVKDILLSFGGMAATTVLARNTMEQVIGMRWNDDLLSRVCQLLPEDLPLSPEAPGGMTEYRRTLSLSFFFKFYLMVRDRLGSESGERIDDTYRSAFVAPAPVSSRGCQLYEEVVPGQFSHDEIGRPCKTVSAENQTTGETVYIDDMPQFRDELHGCFILSTKAHAKLLNVDPSEALTMPGVVDYVSHSDFTGRNIFGALVQDEEIFASDMVYSQGQLIGLILADTHVHAQKAARMVKIQYEVLDHILTCQEAVAKSSFFSTGEEYEVMTDGDIEAGFAESDHILEGNYSVGGQEHFYFETQCCIALPKNEDGEMEIFSSTQEPCTTQRFVAATTGVPRNRIVVRVKRIGGAFGGKESRATLIAGIAAVAANKLQRAVRLVLDREEDMLFSGTRHPFYSTYKVGVTNDGKLKVVEIKFYANGGWSHDMTKAVVHRAILLAENCYKFPNIRVMGYSCKTNTPSNTAFRGFGGPQSVLICENIMDHIASTHAFCPVKLREMNMYKDGDMTPYRQTLECCTIKKCWDECLRQSNFHKRQEEIKQYNRENRWIKRGISIIPIKMGMSFEWKHFNQAGALVHVYTDGSVLLTHGGVEMGQGLHTKMIQVASRVLQIPSDRIFISETSTSTVPNTIVTATSASSDLNGMAVLEACQTIRDRLEPYIKAVPNGQWDEWVMAAYMDQVSLSATGYYKVSDPPFDFAKNEGSAYSYYGYGVGCSEVQIDCLTGDHQILRTDIVMDVGTSLNPAIDIGQIEGGFIQGYGMVCLEQQKFSPSGSLLSRGPHTYKIPSMQNIPKVFNVSLLKGNPNPKAIYSSKGIGEPPVFLAISVLLAIKDAIRSARSDAGIEGHFELDSPATAERIRMACADQFTDKFSSADAGSYTPWFVTLS